LTRVLAAAMGEALQAADDHRERRRRRRHHRHQPAAKARADGYTLLLYHIGMATSPALYRKLPYDTLNDFDYIGQVADVPMMLIARKATPAATFASSCRTRRPTRTS
jgi:hypothetical protein